MDGSSYFPSRPEMERNIAIVRGADRDPDPLRLPRGPRPAARRRPTASASSSRRRDGEYRAQVLVFAVGVAEPYAPATPGIELAAHYADTRPAETYAGRRIFIMGKQNSGFELATGLLPWARRIVLCSPSPAKLSVNTRSLVGVRARYVQPFEDHVLGGGVAILDASIERDRARARTGGRAIRRHGPAVGRRRGARDRGRRGDLRDRLRDAAARPAGRSG